MDCISNKLLALEVVLLVQECPVHKKKLQLNNGIGNSYSVAACCEDMETLYWNHMYLGSVLLTMDIPPLRIADAAWLNRNLSIRNADHPLHLTAVELIRKILKE